LGLEGESKPGVSPQDCAETDSNSGYKRVKPITYEIGNIIFIVTSVYAGNSSKTIGDVVLALMIRDDDVASDQG
jgi:hypothetical protein